MKIRDFGYELNLGECGEYFCDYWNGGYISDIMRDIADNHTSCYNSDLLNWLSNNLANDYYIEQYLDNMDVTQEQFDELTLKDYSRFERLEEIDDFIKETMEVE